MVQAQQKRDKAYYLRLLKKRHPDVFARVGRGELTETEALHVTGVKPRPHPLVSLRREWRKASVTERKQFILEAGPDLDGIQRTAAYQLVAAWGRCDEADRAAFLYTLLGTPPGRALIRTVLETYERASAPAPTTV